MDFDLFSSVLQNLLHIDVLRPREQPGAFEMFEKKYCYHPALQPMFTAATLAELASSMEDRMFYQARGQLGICLLLFRVEGEVFIAGPFVREEADERKILAALISNHLPAAYAHSIRLYYGTFPLISSTDVRSAVQSCIRAFSPAAGEYDLCRLEDTGERPSLPTRPDYTEVIDYSTLRQRYDLENRFLGMIERGDTENVLMAFREMHMRGLSQHRYVNAIYQDPAIGLTIIRALARKAAERGGADIVEVNEITQRAVQKLLTTNRLEEQLECTRAMLLELTGAVREHRFMLGKYSAPVRAAVALLRRNYSQTIPMERLAETAGISASGLSKAFHRETGMTIPQYMANLRCARAAQLLAGSSLTIQEISMHVGYPDSNYFVKVFKKEYGATPSDYRAQAGQINQQEA